jgi:electron transfer flavoprotein beta subunit
VSVEASAFFVRHALGWAGARQEIVSVGAAPERQAGEKIEDDGEGYARIVAFLEQLKVV